MMRVNPIQTNFTSGELSESMLGRSDIERYFNSALVLENFRVQHQGPIVRRLGTRHHAEAFNQGIDDVCRVVDFVFSQTDSIVIMMEEGQFAFLDHGEVLSTSPSFFAPYLVTTEYNEPLKPIPYTNEEINDCQFSQSADVLYITHPNHPQAMLSRYGKYDWRYELVPFDNGPYMDQKPGDNNTSLTLYNVVDRLILTSNISDFTLALAPVGTLVQYDYAGQKMLGIVTVRVSDSEVQIRPYEDRSFLLSKEVYSPGEFSSWDGTTNLPVFVPIVPGTTQAVAFSATGVITPENIDNYVRFPYKDGTYHWMLVQEVRDIVQQGAYGIIAYGPILQPLIPAGNVTRHSRLITGKLKSSQLHFFDTLIPDSSPAAYDFRELSRRKFRLVLGDQVVHCTALEDTTGQTSNDIVVIVNRPLPLSVEGAAPIHGKRGAGDDELTTTAITTDWNKGAWYPGNYPRAISIHEERLTFGGTIKEPQTGWMSKSADFYNFASTDDSLVVSDNSAITFTIASDTVNEILWMVSRKVLLVGTAGGESLITPSGTANALTPTNISIQNQSNFGSEAVKPLLVGKAALYLQRAGDKLRQMMYSFQTDSQESLDLNVFAEHLLQTHGGGRQICYQLLPESVVWVRLGDGQIACLTYESDQQVYAWSRMVIGGDAFVESVICIPENNIYRLYMVATRTINGDLYRTVESLEPQFRPAHSFDFETMIFLDGWFAYEAPWFQDMINLVYFAGCTVSAIIDNAVYENLTVSPTGDLHLPVAPTERLVIGFPYTSTLQTFPIEAQAMAGTGQGKIKRIGRITVRLRDSIGLKHGPSLELLTEEDFRRSTDPMGVAPPMFTGDRSFLFREGLDTRASYFIVQDKSYPLSILSIMPEITQMQ